MSSNSNLQTAKTDKNDEFYTLRSDIEKELIHYDLSGLTIHCPCDNPEHSEFFKYLHDNFQKFNLKQLITTSYDSNIICSYNGRTETQLYTDYNGDFAVTIPVTASDMIITNPPFSLFRDFINLLVKYQKYFLCIGALNGVKYKDIFPLIKEGKIWLGANHGTFNFKVPDNSNRNNVFITPNGERLAKFGNIVWYTNYPNSSYRRPDLTLQNKTKNDYNVYDTYDAIDVPKVKDIPDLSTPMGVPITFLQYHNPEQFEIIGELNHGCDNQYDFAKPIVQGKELFPRVIIKKAGIL